MKYMKLYEAFESDAISSTVGFLKKKLKSGSLDRFKLDLKRISTYLDFPISEIKNENVIYLNKRQALLVRNENRVESNKQGIYCLKYWFSVNDGYLGYTSTGNKVIDSSSAFTDDELDYIKQNIVATGKLKEMEKLSDLKTGQKVICFLNSPSSARLRDLVFGVIYLEDTHIYFIHNNDSYTGREPYNDNWRQYGENSWTFGRVNSPNTEFYKINLYSESDDSLSYNDVTKAKDVMDYNLPLRGNLSPCPWNSTESMFEENLKNADFAIIIMIDDMLKGKFKEVSKTTLGRAEVRKDALKFKTNAEIKNLNINRYMDEVVSRMLNKDTKEVQNLQKMVIKTVCGKYAFFSLFLNSPGNDYIENMMTYITRVLKTDDNIDFVEANYERLRSTYLNLSKESSDRVERFEKSLKIIKQDENHDSDLYIIIEIIEKISHNIYKFLQHQKIDTLEDLRLILIKLNSIQNCFRYDELKFDSRIRNLIGYFTYPQDIKHYVNAYKDTDFKKSISMLKKIEKYINSILN